MIIKHCIDGGDNDKKDKMRNITTSMINLPS